MMRIFALKLMLASLILQAFTCGTDDDVSGCNNEGVVLKFEIPFSISPLTDTMKIGDTMWLESTIQHQLLEQNSGGFVNVTDYEFKVRTGINYIDAENLPEAGGDFEVVNEQGQYFQNRTGEVILTNVIYQKNDNEKSFRAGLVPLKTGIFQTAFYNLAEDLSCENITFKGNEKNNIEIVYTMNAGV